MAWDPDDEEIEEAVAEGNVEWLASVLEWYRNPDEPGKASKPMSVPKSIVAAIDAFEAKCQAEEYTDTDDAWDLLHTIRHRCQP